MRIFEYIMNSTGKKVFHYLFLISVLFSCRVCAMYFLGVEKNFQCPICNFLKGANTDDKTFIVLCDNVPSTPEEIATHSQTTQLKNFDFNSANNFTSTTQTEFGSCVLFPPRVLNIAFNKLYLLYKQLKIGDVFPNITV